MVVTRDAAMRGGRRRKERDGTNTEERITDASTQPEAPRSWWRRGRRDAGRSKEEGEGGTNTEERITDAST